MKTFHDRVPQEPDSIGTDRELDCVGEIARYAGPPWRTEGARRAPLAYGFGMRSVAGRPGFDLDTARLRHGRQASVHPLRYSRWMNGSASGALGA